MTTQTTNGTVNNDGTVNLTLVFEDDAICLQDCDQLIEWIGKGKDSTGVLITIAEEIAIACNMPSDYVTIQLTKYSKNKNAGIK